MRDSLFHVERMETTTLQSQIREMLVSSMLAGQLPCGAPIPSTRAMAKRLKVSRNTVMLAYQALASDGYLDARERSGFYVSKNLEDAVISRRTIEKPKQITMSGNVNWAGKLNQRATMQRNIVKPVNWHEYPYPFIYGQADAALFPITDWRDCSRQAMNRKWLDAWTADRFNEDDPMLVEQIRQRILTRRGIYAETDEILVTLGAQNALFILAELLVSQNTKVLIEDPGYPDMRNIFSLRTDNIHPIKLDAHGICVKDMGAGDIVFVTPSHQFPTNVTMPLERRRQLLSWADTHDGLIIEDDYEFETNYRGEPTPALKSLDGSGRVLYIGSLSKSLMPGLRMGFMVGPKELIAEARAVRRLMLRHPPGNNQRVVAIFLSLGRHDALIARLHRAYRERFEILGTALEKHFPSWSQSPGFGGTSFWVKGPKGFDANALAQTALNDGVVIEPGDIYFTNMQEGAHYFRLGFSSIPKERIEPGIERLAMAAKTVMKG